MNAVILCAGRGERLRPLTDTIPKVMVPLVGKPLLAYTIESLKKSSFDNIFINVYYKGEVIKDYFREGHNYGVRITYVDEAALTGTAAPVKKMEPWLRGEEFLVVYGDKYMEFDFEKFLAWHARKKGIVDMVVGVTKRPTSAGLVLLDAQERIVRFQEKSKPEQVFSNLSNKAIYLLQPDIFHYLPSTEPCDFGLDVFPKLVAEHLPMYGYYSEENIVDVGTPERYQALNQELTSRS